MSSPKEKRHIRNLLLEQDLSHFARLGFLTLGALCLLLVSNGKARAAMTTTNFYGVLFFGLLAVFCGMPGLFPVRYWDYGIEMQEGGFNYYHPFRKPKFIRYTDIHRIVGKTRNEGDGESFSQLLIFAGDAKARLDEKIIWGSGVLDIFKELPGFRNEAMKEFLDVDGSVKWALISKATILLDVESRMQM